MKVYRVITALIIFLSVTACLFQSVCASDADETEKLIQRYQKETKCKSVSVVVFEKGAVSYYGDSISLYQIGSMTKAFTALAVQKLICEGIIDEDGVISDYIPGFKAYYDSEEADITVRNLLEQKSGYTNNEKDYPSTSAVMTLSEWADSISGLKLKQRPGTEYAYSNVNYNLLGLIIENVSNMTYRDYMQQEILNPLGLKNTFVGAPSDKRITEGTRLLYRHVSDYPMEVREASIPAGYFYSNTEDMGRWIGIWTEYIDVPKSIEKPLSKVREYLKEEGDYYSGWELFADGIMGHSGGTPNYTSRIVFDKEDQTGVCVLSSLNVAATTDSLCNSIFDVLSGKAGTGLNKDIWTIFDEIFSAVTVVCMLLIPAVFFVKKRVPLIVTDVIFISLLALVLILFPVIFGASMKEILFIWAPLSLAGGLFTVIPVIAVTTVKLLKTKRNNNEDHNKAGKGQAVNGHN
ncbi:MAG: beta-lactamase family protein [Lachnospiraceae bacterium]|nr:beta-lactamase family protein [Lachnospiraceae bacterium]